jgi:GNAT superfamily N-acetyltransferase
MSIIEIRRWSEGDIATIGDTWLGEYPRAASGPSASYRDAPKRMARWLRDLQRDRTAIGYVAEVDSAFAGFVVGRFTTWESEPPILRPRKVAVIHALWVESRYRRSGVGSGLMNRVVERCRNSAVGAIEAGIEPGARGAGAFWKRLGFDPYRTSARLRVDLRTSAVSRRG